MSERLLGSSVSLSLSSRFAAAAEGEDEDLPPATSEPPSGHIQEMLASTMRQIEERKRQTEVMIVSGGEEEEGGRGRRRGEEEGGREEEEGVPSGFHRTHDVWTGE